MTMYSTATSSTIRVNPVSVPKFRTVGVQQPRDNLKRSWNLDGYLNLANKALSVNKAQRTDFSVDDLALTHDLMRKYYDMNILVTEILAINRVLKRLDDQKIYAMTNNLYRVMNSLARQRDKVFVCKCAVQSLRPEPYEVEYLQQIMRDTDKRIQFIRGTILPENLELTPIKEYLELTGAKSLADDIYEKIGNRKELVEIVARAGDPDGRVDRYVAQVLETVRKAGKETAYQERIAGWYERSERIKAEKTAEEKAERDARNLKDAEAYMRYFRSEFNRCIRTLDGNESVGISRISLEKMLNKNGRNVWVVIRCYMYGGNPVYRYYKGGGVWKKMMFGAKVFTDEEEATEVVRRYAEEYRGQVFDVMKMGHAEEAYV